MAIVAVLGAACGGDDAEDGTSDGSADAIGSSASSQTGGGTGDDATTGGQTAAGGVGSASQQGDDGGSGSGEDVRSERRDGTLAESSVTVAIVAVGGADDLGLTQSVVDGVVLLGLTPAVTERVATADAAQGLRAAAEGGARLVIAAGEDYGEAVAEVAPDFPDTSFAWGPGSDTFGLANVYGLDARGDQGAYLLGTIAAELSLAEAVAVSGATITPDAKRFTDGFEAGAKAFSEAVAVDVAYTGPPNDVTVVLDTVNAQIGNGADAISRVGPFAQDAADLAAERGVAWFANHTDQSGLGDHVVASQVYRWDVVFAEVITAVESGELGGEVVTLTLQNEGLAIVYNPAYELGPGAKRAAEATAAGIADGSIDTGATP